MRKPHIYLLGAGMKLLKWATNSADMRGYIEKKEQSGTPDKTKILGLMWDTKEDTLSVNVQPVLEWLKNEEPTKRFILQTSARIYDPLGFVAPFLIRVKILFQRIWRIGTSWDHGIPDELVQDWKNWLRELPDIASLAVPRLCHPSSSLSVTELHVFTDVSNAAYGAVAYLCIPRHAMDSDRHFLMVKARVAPLKELSLPRLELTAALVGARLSKFIGSTINIPSLQYFCWTDSMVALSWIKGSVRSRSRLSVIESLKYKN